MNTGLLITAVIIIIITIRISVEINLQYNLIDNVGKVQIKIFRFITVFNSNISIIGDYLNFSNKKAKSINIKLDVNDVNIQYFNELGSYIRNKIIITKLISKTNICLENPMVCSVVSSSINAVLSLVFINFRKKYDNANISNTVNTGFRHNIINTNITFAFIINIYDLFWSILRTLFIVRRNYGKEKTAKSTESAKQQNNT